MDTNEFPPSGSPPPPPPLPASPPVLLSPSPARAPKKGRGWMILAIILFVLLGFSVLMNLGHLMESFLGAGQRHAYANAGPRLDEVVLEDNDGRAKIAVIPIEGIITSGIIDRSGFSMVDVIKAQLDRAAKDERVKAVLLKVDSPGGEVLASDDIAKAIAQFQADKRHGKPVIVAMGSLAASGGYYVSAPARWIVANELTITGSIGVIMSTWNYRGLMSKVGIRPLTYKSGRFKDMLSGSREPDEIPAEEREMIQSLIDETYAKFRNVVADGRDAAFQENQKANQAGRKLAANWRDYADGRILSGNEAHRLGFVDQLGDYDDALDQAAEIAGIGDAFNVVEYRLRYDLGDFLRMFGQTETRGVKVDLGMDMPKLEAGRMYFLSPTYLH